MLAFQADSRQLLAVVLLLSRLFGGFEVGLQRVMMESGTGTPRPL